MLSHTISSPPLVMREHNSKQQMYANFVALFLKKAAANGVSVKVVYNMVSPHDMRLYQDRGTRDVDLNTLTESTFQTGSRFRPWSIGMDGKMRPGPTLH